MTDFIKETLRLAEKAAAHGDVPVGAVVARAGRIIARGENQVQLKLDPTMHAEIVAIRRACAKLGSKFLDDCEIYVSLEPCAMCAAAISLARIKRVVFAARDEKGGAVLHGARVFDTARNLWKPDVAEAPEYAALSAGMLREFFKRRRGAFGVKA